MDRTLIEPQHNLIVFVLEWMGVHPDALALEWRRAATLTHPWNGW